MNASCLIANLATGDQDQVFYLNAAVFNVGWSLEPDIHSTFGKKWDVFINSIILG